MRAVFFDIEADGLLDEATKIHCFCASVYEGNREIYKVSLSTKKAILQFMEFEKISVFIGHNIILYDFPLLKKLYGFTFSGLAMDTLAMSWKLFPDQEKHGLAYYGDLFGVPKPYIEDWQKGEKAEYVIRCETDVVITSILFGKLYSYFRDIYAPDSPDRDIYYCTWKLKCIEQQQRNPLKIDRQRVNRVLEEVEFLMQEKEEELKKAMPKVEKYKKLKRPSSLLKKDGTLSVKGEKWFTILDELGLPPDTTEEVEVLDKTEEPNPTSIPQLKKWLYSLGWTPTIYVYRKNKTGIKKVAQIQDDNKELCGNILLLSEKHKELEALQGLFMLQHRRGILQAFLEYSDLRGYITTEIAGFTNTMRFKHKKPIVNLPSVERPYGKEIRGSIIAESSEHLFCGSDMKALEDTTKQHYMYFYDPEYVEQMRVPGFDPHLDIAELAGILTSEQVMKHKTKEENYNSERKLGKIVNFSAIYGAGPPKISLTSGLSLELSTQLHKTYWKRNKAVKQVIKNTFFRKVHDALWLFNPVSQMWYYLKNTKDIFSTLNQGTGVYCFDVWVKEVQNQSVVVQLQYHDEIGFSFLKKEEEKVKQALHKAIQVTNEKLQLNVPLGISIDIGQNYGEAH